MGESSKIEWTDHTFNPWIGCTKVAEGCKHCYAEAFAKRTGGAKWGDAGTRILTSPANWAKPLKWNREAEQAGKRARVFCSSLADVFENWHRPMSSRNGEVWIRPFLDRENVPEMRMTSELEDFHKDPQGWRLLTMADVVRDLFRLIDKTPNLDWLLLTKRPQNILNSWPCARDTDGDGNCHICCNNGMCPRPNVWLGTSVACASDLKQNVPHLVECRTLARVLFLSMEPLVGPVDLYNDYPSEEMVDWIIVGGESGPGARQMQPDWVSRIRDDCRDFGVPFFFKQWGGVHKEKNGRELDGEIHSAMPKVVTRKKRVSK